MYFLIIILLLLCAIFDFRYQKIRFDILIFLLIMSLLFRIENSDKTKLISELLFLILFFSILHIINHFFIKTTSYGKNMLLNSLSLGDKILFLSLILFLGVEKGIIIILFGLLTALLWVKVERNYFKRDRCQRKTIPIYPFMVLSLIVVDII